MKFPKTIWLVESCDCGRAVLSSVTNLDEIPSGASTSYIVGKYELSRSSKFEVVFERLDYTLKPCGHCGSKDQVKLTKSAAGYTVECNAKGCSKPTTCYHESPQESVDEWNEETV